MTRFSTFLLVSSFLLGKKGEKHGKRKEKGVSVLSFQGDERDISHLGRQLRRRLCDPFSKFLVAVTRNSTEMFHPLQPA
jgi:hypothetical protein